jgi:hypothetical protein
LRPSPRERNRVRFSAAAVANQTYGIDVEQKRGGANFVGSFWTKDMRISER